MRSESSRSRSSSATSRQGSGSNGRSTCRSKIVVTEATNPQVRQVVKTYAPGVGPEVVEVPHDGGTTDPDRVREAARDAAAVIFQQPNFFGCLEPAPDLATAAAEAD